MTPLPTRQYSLPFHFRGRLLFSVPLRLVLKDVSLPEALAGMDAVEAGSEGFQDGSDGALHCRLPDPGWRTHALYEDRVTYVLNREVWHYLSLGGSYEGFLHSRFSAKTREAFAQEEAGFAAECGTVLALRAYRNRAELAAFAALQQKIGVTGAEDPDPLQRLAAGGAMVAFVLFAGAQPVAWLKLLEHGDTVRYLGAGEAQGGVAGRASAIVHRQVIRHLFDEGRHRYLDFCPGESEVKRQFANGALRSAMVLKLRRTLLNRLLLKVYGFSRRLAAGRDGQPVLPVALTEVPAYAG